MSATRRAHNPYRTSFRKEPSSAPKITFKTRIVSKIITLKVKILKVLTVWKKPATKRNIRRAIRTSSIQAKNKADPHLGKRV